MSSSLHKIKKINGKYKCWLPQVHLPFTFLFLFPIQTYLKMLLLWNYSHLTSHIHIQLTQLKNNPKWKKMKNNLIAALCVFRKYSVFHLIFQVYDLFCSSRIGLLAHHLYCGLCLLFKPQQSTLWRSNHRWMNKFLIPKILKMLFLSSLQIVALNSVAIFFTPLFKKHPERS